MPESAPKPEEVIAFRGKLFEIAQLTQPDGRVFEVARRAPGVRLIINDPHLHKVLLTKEYRQELNGWDYRLPGGKVFDSLEEYDNYRASGEPIIEAATKKAKAEALEEAGIVIDALDLYKTSTLGATMEWDLHIFVTSQFAVHADGQQLEAGENIDATGWFSYQEAQQMIMDGQMSEGRAALVLLQWLAQNDVAQSNL